MPDKHGPLSVLARKMQSLGPPSLGVLIARLGEIEEYEDFIALVREYLPEREADVLNQSTPAGQMAAFASHFEDLYFPLDDYMKLGDAECYSDLTRAIPTICRGLSCDEYHYIATDAGPGVQLMTYLVEDPYDMEPRASLAEACREHVHVDLLQRVALVGLSPGEAHQLLDDTPYKALAIWSDIIRQDTGNFFLDTDCETLGYNGYPDWERGVVEELTRQWLQADLLDQQVRALDDWLEGDLKTRFEEIVNFITERRESE